VGHLLGPNRYSRRSYGLRRPRRRSHHLDLPHVRPDGVRTRADHSLLGRQRPCGRAHQQYPPAPIHPLSHRRYQPCSRTCVTRLARRLIVDFETTRLPSPRRGIRRTVRREPPRLSKAPSGKRRDTGRPTPHRFPTQALPDLLIPTLRRARHAESTTSPKVRPPPPGRGSPRLSRMCPD
jgi:hypothetical protein